jgi:hypothetical protein
MWFNGQRRAARVHPSIEGTIVFIAEEAVTLAVTITEP